MCDTKRNDGLHSVIAEIPISKLVPFGNNKFTLFQGAKLEEMCKSVGLFDIRYPIRVRKKSDDLYEIIDGHYRVAAYRKLYRNMYETVTIRAYIIEGMSDEKALSYISGINPIGLKLKYGIDIFSENFKNSKGFISHCNMRIEYNQIHMKLEEYIEKYLLDKHYVYDLYPSIYSMGNPYELAEDECTDEKVAAEIVRQFISDSEIVIEDKVEGVVNLLNQKKSGYIQQLKKHLAIDLNEYDYKILRNKQERAKMFFFIYELKKHKFPELNILELLGRPSMENYRYTPLYPNSSNGKYVDFVLCEIEKELGPMRKYIFHEAISIVNTLWYNYMICNVVDLMRANCDFSKLVEKEIVFLKSPFCSKTVSYSTRYPLEALYLKLLQNQSIGMVEDEIKNLNSSCNEFNKIPQKYREEIGQSIKSRKMSREEIEEYFNPENVKKIAKYVYLRDENSIDKEDRRRIRNCKEKVLRFFEFLNLEDQSGKTDVSGNECELLIISCLQCILLGEQNEIFNYTYHGFEGRVYKRKGRIHVQAALKNDKNDYGALELLWIGRVVRRAVANLRDDVALELSVEFIRAALETHKRVLHCSSIEEVQEMSNFYFGEYRS